MLRVDAAVSAWLGSRWGGERRMNKRQIRQAQGTQAREPWSGFVLGSDSRVQCGPEQQPPPVHTLDHTGLISMSTTFSGRRVSRSLLISL